jgi:hypothetical protein
MVHFSAGSITHVVFAPLAARYSFPQKAGGQFSIPTEDPLPPRCGD